MALLCKLPQSFMRTMPGADVDKRTYCSLNAKVIECIDHT